MEEVLFSWSGGKDSALALFKVLKDKDMKVTGLLSTIREDGKMPMHEVDETLLESQAKNIKIPYIPVYLPTNAGNLVYEQRLSEKLLDFRKKGIKKVVHGDIFLEDVRRYREKQLKKIELEGYYPLWGKSTSRLANQFVEAGFRSIVTCVDTDCLSREWIGREFNDDFLSELPENVDPCGENGEFHTFVFDGPIFSKPVTYEKTQIETSWNGRFVHLSLKRP